MIYILGAIVGYETQGFWGMVIMLCVVAVIHRFTRNP